MDSPQRADITVNFPHGRSTAGELTAHVYADGVVVATGSAWMRGTSEPASVSVPGWEPVGTWDLISLGMSHGQWIVSAERIEGVR